MVMAITSNSEASGDGRLQRPPLVTEGQFVHRRLALPRNRVSQPDARSTGASFTNQLAAGIDTEATLDFAAELPALFLDVQPDGCLHRSCQLDAFRRQFRMPRC